MQLFRRVIAASLSGLLVWTPACQTTDRVEGNASQPKDDGQEQVPESVIKTYDGALQTWQKLMDDEKWRAFVDTDKGMQSVASADLKKTAESVDSQKLWLVSPDTKTGKVVGIRSKMVLSPDQSFVFGIEAVDWNKKRKTLTAQKFSFPASGAELSQEEIVKLRADTESSMKAFMQQIQDFTGGKTDGLGLVEVSALKLSWCGFYSLLVWGGMASFFGTSRLAYGESSRSLIFVNILATAGFFGGCVYFTDAVNLNSKKDDGAVKK